MDKSKTFCPMAGCDGVCDGLPGVAQPTVCQEVIKASICIAENYCIGGQEWYQNCIKCHNLGNCNYTLLSLIFELIFAVFVM